MGGNLKKCCAECFDSYGFWDYISETGFIDNCDFCSKKDEKCLYLDDEIFIKMFSLIRNMYTEMLSLTSKRLVDYIIEDWRTFSESTDSNYLFEELCKVHGVNYYSDYMFNPNYTKYIDIWENYKKTVKHKSRFQLLPEKLALILSTQDDNYVKLRNNTLYRARIGCADEVNLEPYLASIEDMGMPPIDRAKEGRANPAGIPYLYLASGEETAIAEVRPYTEALITLGEFHLNESLNTITFSVFDNRQLFKYIIEEEVEESLHRLNFFNVLSFEMSKPVSPFDSYLEYLPTQCIAEYIKNEGFDGIIFDSSLGSGQNVVLFYQNKVAVSSTKLIKVRQIQYIVNDC